MNKEKKSQLSNEDKKNLSKDKKTEYYVINKVTGKKHRMYLEDEYDLTAPRKKKE